MAGSVRLIKIASEINIGKDAIVEFLKGKGFTVENKPTAILNEEMVEAIYDKFKKELKAAETQRQKIEKHKMIRKSDTPEKSHDKEDIVSKSINESQVITDEEHTTLSSENQINSQKDTAQQVDQKDNKDENLIENANSIPLDNKDENLINISTIDETEKSNIKADLNINKIDVPVSENVENATLHSTQQGTSDKYKVNDVIQLPDESFNRKRKKKDKLSDSKISIDKQNTDKRRDTKISSNRKDDNKSLKSRPSKSDRFKENNILNGLGADKLAQLSANIKKSASVPKDKPINVSDKKHDKKTFTPEKKIESPDPKQVENEISNDIVSSSSERKKRKRKSKKIAEVEYDVNHSTQLKGLTVVGKMSLDSQKESSGKFGNRNDNKRASSGNQIDDEETNKFKKKGKKSKSLKPTSLSAIKDLKSKKKLSVRELITDEDVTKAIRRTLSDMGEANSMSNRNKSKLRKKAEREEKFQIQREEEAKEEKILHLTEFVTTSDLAKMIGISANEIIMKCMGMGLMVSINQRLDKDTISIIADDYGLEVEFIDDKALQAIDEIADEDDEDTLIPRSPIVTIMGHVDHGKTSLLDYIRNANVVAGEAGGITQHIGAYRVKLDNGKYITFLDTPGHEAFTAMRARGAQVTDTVVLVVAADDSVMPQTIEAISHAQAASVPIIVAINKIDKPDAQPDRIRQQLSNQNILVEEWGGKYQSVEISAKKGDNVDKLLDKILLEAEMLNLKANPDRLARATVIEANMTKGLGPVCTVIVQKGTLRVGDPFVVGHQFGRVRAMMDERGKKIEAAAPSIPARVIGLNGLPEAGDILTVTESDVDARNIANERQQLKRQQEFNRTKHVTLDDISKKISEGVVKDLSLIIKGDVGGSVEALSDSLMKLSTNEVRVNIIHKGVGQISESDVMLAVASGAIIIGFQVSPTSYARKLAENESVDIRQYSIIYDCIDEVKRALEGLLTPELKEDITSVIEVRKIFKISRLGVIAGCQVMNGKIHRNDKVRLLRDGLPIFTGYIDSLKRGKDDTREVDSGYECGIALDGFNDIEVGDVIEGFKVLEIKRKLEYDN